MPRIGVLRSLFLNHSFTIAVSSASICACTTSRFRRSTGRRPTRRCECRRASGSPPDARMLVCSAAGALVFGVLATMNAAGYRYGVADQAFYVPAVLRHLDPSLYPQDGWLIGSQAKLLDLRRAVRGGASRDRCAAAVAVLRRLCGDDGGAVSARWSRSAARSTRTDGRWRRWCSRRRCVIASRRPARIRSKAIFIRACWRSRSACSRWPR